MKTVNALEIRNHLGRVLEELEKTREPILVSKGRQVRAVIITIEDFKNRFIDRQVEEEKDRLLKKIHDLGKKRIGARESTDVLRETRGYKE
jgi:PHD/YefM family antitoxin component YafN of YafNO toxin-antitoxin module